MGFYTESHTYSMAHTSVLQLIHKELITILGFYDAVCECVRAKRLPGWFGALMIMIMMNYKCAFASFGNLSAWVVKQF